MLEFPVEEVGEESDYHLEQLHTLLVDTTLRTLVFLNERLHLLECTPLVPDDDCLITFKTSRSVVLLFDIIVCQF